MRTTPAQAEQEVHRKIKNYEAIFSYLLWSWMSIRVAVSETLLGDGLDPHFGGR
jgi:hypothetical protein